MVGDDISLGVDEKTRPHAPKHGTFGSLSRIGVGKRKRLTLEETAEEVLEIAERNVWCATKRTGVGSDGAAGDGDVHYRGHDRLDYVREAPRSGLCDIERAVNGRGPSRLRARYQRVFPEVPDCKDSNESQKSAHETNAISFERLPIHV
jgi:hypothetical protein